jgi:hypothetical protein
VDQAYECRPDDVGGAISPEEPEPEKGEAAGVEAEELDGNITDLEKI